MHYFTVCLEMFFALFASLALCTIYFAHCHRFKRHYSGSFIKNGEEVLIPECLELAPYTVDLLQSNSSYSLFGMTNHHGTFMHNGHYTAVCHRGDRWYRFDDTKVSNTTTRQLGRASDSAYLVWYRLKKDIVGDLPLDSDITDKTTTTELINNLSPCNPDQHFLDFDIESEVDMFAMTDEESDTGSDDKVFSMRILTDDDKLFSKTILSDDENNNLFDPATGISNLTIQATPQPQLSNPSQVSSVSSQQQCDHPPYDLDVMDPQLSEGEVTGAKIKEDELEKKDNKSLMRWLHCRRLPTRGNKAKLIERIMHHVKNDKGGKIYQGVDGGKWYERKRKKLIAQAHQSNQNALPMMPVGNKVFQPFPSVHIPNKYSSAKARDYLDLIPNIRFSYVGGVESEDGDGDEQVVVDFSQPTQQDRKNIFVDGTLKRANQFIDSGRVLGITDCIRNLHYFVKADVRASYVADTYKVSVMISKNHGNVCFAECTCKARALARCCHIMAVLLLIGRHVESKGHEAVTCTGRLCYWLAPGSATHRQPGVVREKNEYYKKSANFKRRAYFDPRPTVQQLDCDPERVSELRSALSGMATKLLWHYQLLESPIIPESYPDVVCTYQIAEMCSHLIWNLNSVRDLSTNRPIHLVKTAGQSGSKFWHSERSVRLTASVAKNVLGLSSDKTRLKFLRKHVWGLDPFRNEAMERGSQLEDPARKAYTLHLKENNVDIDILESGTWVNPAFPQLSCSPDGLIVDTNGITRLLEIKCPAVLTEMDPNEFEKLPKKQLSNFCIRRNKQTAQLELKPTDKWYYQVQMSLSIMQLEWCDFVIYSTVKEKPKFMCIKVQYDEEFWREKRERLVNIHREWLVPEHFLANTVFNRVPTRLMYAPFHEDHSDDFFLFEAHATDEDQSSLKETEDAFLIRYRSRSQKLLLKICNT
ncbi:uncharacterized protein LOC113214347 isoform X1 [Frankliniella occidentalis]|uniref:Uncharacterized protein LOC113214347 isoform X1 n=1 Tax=Frankliniella occidentalis TaxID=133901 RepID=A0A9C6UAA2_FRAOC|nr:uncharacterized protein LOC113214347 isoform X1 [Frankliniella occidentalis]